MRYGFLLLSVMCLSGCVIVADVDADWDWNGNWVTKKQGVDDVERVEFNARGTLYIIQGPRSALQLEGNEKALEQLRIEERDGALVITQAGDQYRWFEIRGKSSEPVYTLEISNLQNIRHSGHGEINVGPFTLEMLDVETSGHAQTYIASINARRVNLSTAEHGHIRVETLDSDAMTLRSDGHADIYIQDASVLDASVHAQSHGEVWVAGTADSVNVKLRDHSDLQADDFTAAIARVRASDHARAQVQVSGEIELDQRDHASVVVTGDAQIKTAGL